MPARGTREYNVKTADAAVSNTAAYAYTNQVVLSRYTEALALLYCSDSSGTSPTITLKVQVKDSAGSNWYDLTTLVSTLDVNTASTTAVAKAYAFTNFGSYVRLGYIIGGSSTPTATFSLDIIAKD